MVHIKFPNGFVPLNDSISLTILFRLLISFILPDKCGQMHFFFSPKLCIVKMNKNRLNVTVLLGTKIMLQLMVKKAMAILHQTGLFHYLIL